MRFFNKIFLILFLCLSLSCSSAISNVPKSSITKDTEYGFKYYTDHLNNGLFPQIEKTIKKYNRYLTKDEIKSLANEVKYVIKDYFVKNKIYVQVPRLRVAVYSSPDGKKVVINLEIQMIFLDKEESWGSFINSTLITKNFLIFTGQAKAGEKI